MSDTSPASEGAFLPQGSRVKAERVSRHDEPAAEMASVMAERPPSAALRYLATTLVSALVATVISVGINLWMAKLGARGDRLVQDGKVIVGQNGPRVVFYAEPFAGPPNLELESPNMVFVTLKEQKADHFTVEARVNTEVHWRAEGMPVK